MFRTHFTILTCVVTVSLATISVAEVAADEDRHSAFLAKHCLRCHGEDDPEGDVSLADLQLASLESSESTPTAESISVWRRVLEAVKFGRMPPADGPQPDFDSNERFASQIAAGLAAAGYESDVEHRLRQPAYANLLNHEKLFDGSANRVAFSPPRLWRLHPQAYENVLSTFGRELNRGGPLSKPFTVGDDKGLVSNYAGLLQADSATLSQLILNCKQIAQLQTIGFKRMEKDRKSKQLVEKLYRRAPDSFMTLIEAKDEPTDEQLRAAVVDEFQLVLSRPPSEAEATAYTDLLTRSIEIGGVERGLRTMAMAVLLRPEAIYRMEVGLGERDEHGRRHLSPYELAYAIAYALTDTPPDKLLLGPPRKNDRSRRPTAPSLMELAEQGKLSTREQVRDVVSAMWDNDAIEKPRILRFFREFFGYHHAETVFKGDRAGREFAPRHLVKDADDLVLHHVRRDRDVLKQLLTTEEYFVVWPGSLEDYERRIDYITKRIKPDKKKDVNYRYFIERTEKGLRPMPQANPTWRKTIRFYNLDEWSWDYPLEQPFAMPEGQRVGMLTHPTWLAAWSGNFDNDPIRRGKWIREHLLAGSIPDVPITVDASVPQDPHKTLRQRLEKTRAKECWVCHQKMDPLGFPFEAYDDFGQYRAKEGLGATRALGKPKKTAPVVSDGAIINSGDAAMDGSVKDVRELMHRLAASPRVQQSFVRHAFRYWMGRNEMMTDSTTLIAADKAYGDNSGSFKSLVISLLTSDSFLYRK